jgi:hypothetical protein
MGEKSNAYRLLVGEPEGKKERKKERKYVGEWMDGSWR